MAQPITREAFVEMLHDYVRDALQQRLQDKHSSHFALLLTSFDRLPTLPAHEAKASIKALTQHVSLVDHVAHEQLLLKLFAPSLWDFAPDVAEAVTVFAVTLVSANTACLHGCIDVLVSNFTPPALSPDKAVDHSSRALQSQTVLHQVHSALGKIMDLVPSAAAVVLQIILQRLPHKRFEKETHQQFLHSVFRIAETPQGLPIRDGLLLGVIDRLLEVDVEIKYEDLDDIDDDDESGSDVDADALFQLEESPHVEDAAHSLPKSIDETADKLDGMMDIVFAYMGRRMAAREVPYLVQVLLRAFHSSLLQTYKSKFTQYLMFYVCAHDTSLQAAVAFCTALNDKLADSSQPVILRIAAASYLASFLARASFLSPAFVLQYLAALSRWCQAFLDHHAQPPEQAAAERPGSEAQSVFEAVCQGLLYVLCYRMEAFSEGSAHATAALRALPLDRLFNHQLQPLRACAPTIAYEYARRSRSLRMPGRTAARAAASLHMPDLRDPRAAPGSVSRQRRPLDTFFPFDPYLLRRSAAQLDLRRSYIRWQSSDAGDHDAFDGFESDDNSTLSGLDDHPGSFPADDSFREGHLFVPVQVGLARPAPLGATAMSYEEAAMLSGSSFGGLSLQ